MVFVEKTMERDDQTKCDQRESNCGIWKANHLKFILSDLLHKKRHFKLIYISVPLITEILTKSVS
jgi:hypothetical protein